MTPHRNEELGLSIPMPMRPLLPPVPDRSGLLSPAVRRLAALHHVDPARVRGTGPGGRVTRGDMRAWIDRLAEQSDASASAPSAGGAQAESGRTARTAAIEVDLQACRLLQADAAREATNATGPVLDDASLLARAVVGAVGLLRRPGAAGGGASSSDEIEIDVAGGEVADEAGTLTRRFHTVRGVRLLRELAGRSRSDGRDSSWPAASPARAPLRIAVLGSTPYGIDAGARTVDASHVAVVTIEGVRRRAVVVSSSELDGIAVRPVGFVTISWIEAVFTERAVYEFLEGIRIELEQLPWRAELGARA